MKQKLGENIHQDNKKPKDRALFNTVQINENLSDENLQQEGEKNQGFLVYYAKNVFLLFCCFARNKPHCTLILFNQAVCVYHMSLKCLFKEKISKLLSCFLISLFWHIFIEIKFKLFLCIN